MKNTPSTIKRLIKWEFVQDLLCQKESDLFPKLVGVILET